jgi:hypothetical protein
MIDVGIISAPRPYLANSLDSFFDEWPEVTPHVCAEPGVTGFRNINRVTVHLNERTLGCVRNWVNATTWLYENTDSPFVMVCEDDIQWTSGSGANVRNLLKVLTGEIWVPVIQEKMPLSSIGFISPYCAKLNRPHKIGWEEGKYGKCGLLGALSIIMPRSSLHHVYMNRDELLRISNGVCLDYAIGELFIGRINLTHRPTLIFHIGEESTFPSNNTIQNRNDPSRQPAL